MNIWESGSAIRGRKECVKEGKTASSLVGEDQNCQEFDLKPMGTSSIQTVTVDVHLIARSSSSIDTICTDRLISPNCPQITLADINSKSDHSDRSQKSIGMDCGGAGRSSGGARFKLPSAVKMGSLLSRKKDKHSPILNMDMEGNGSPTLSLGEQKSANNRSHNKSISSVVDVGEKNANETNPLLLRRLNNRLRGRKVTTLTAPKADFDELVEEGGSGRLESTSTASCGSFASHFPRKQTMVRRLFSKEDPGPSNVALVTVAAVATTAAIVDEIGALGSDTGSASSDCNKSASFSSALDMCWGGKPMTTGTGAGTKYRLLKEGQIQVCRLNHPRSLVGKLTSSKLLRRWETHVLILEGEEIRSKTPIGSMEQPIKYVNMEDVHALPQWDSCEKFCVRLFVPEGSVLLQTNRVYVRNQWLYSIQWRRNMFRYRRVIESNCNRPEVLLKELKSMVELALSTPLQGSNLNLKPIKLACLVLQQISEGKWPKTMTEPVISCVAPILDTITIVSEISQWLSKHCQECPRSRIINEALADVAILTLKKNMDFGKYTSARVFVQNFLFALSSQNDGTERVKAFVRSAHGPASTCPHPRILSNLVSVCLAAMHGLYDTNGSPSPSKTNGEEQQRLATKSSSSSLIGEQLSSSNSASDPGSTSSKFTSSPSSPSVSSVSLCFDVNRRANFLGENLEVRDGSEFQEFISKQLACLAAVFETMSEFEDWRMSVASLLQPIPFPEPVLSHEAFLVPFSRLVRRVGTDNRCDVHLTVLGVREGKEGWFHLFCPGGPACVDDGDLYATLLKNLLHCCCRRKKFLVSLNSMLGPLQLLALRESESAMEAICLMLEFETLEGEDLKLQMITALQSTPAGKILYAALCDRQIALQELQQKGGPRKLTLPSKSTDADLAVLLSSGSFGNLEWLSLAFTNVTSACAEYLIKLPALRYLNLWSTQFGDVGVQLISEHLHKLQVLNLCETPVTDKGLASLTALTSLRKLNLNSTQLSAKTFQMLRAKLPALQEADVRYTDAWCADEFPAWS